MVHWFGRSSIFLAGGIFFGLAGCQSEGSSEGSDGTDALVDSGRDTASPSVSGDTESGLADDGFEPSGDVDTTLEPEARDVQSDGADSITNCDPPSGVGGGAEYVEYRRCRGESTYCDPPQGATTVSTASELRAGLESAGEGDVVYIEPETTIDVTGEETFQIPAGVTVASNRGCDGAEGGRLKSDEAGTMLASDGPGAEVFGVRLRGYGESQTPHPRESPNAIGVRIVHPDASVGNSEISNFVFMCVQVDKGGTEARIHHNEITFCNRPGYGYGVAVYHEVPVIEFNFIDHYRHAIAVGGRTNLDEEGYGGYVAKNNVAGENRLSHAFDVHGEERDGSCGQWCGGTAGEKIVIHRNTFLPGDKYNSDYRTQAHVEIRGVPAQTAQISNNWFEGDVVEEYKFEQMDTHGPPYNSERYENIEFRDNHFEETEPPSCEIGAPRDGC